MSSSTLNPLQFDLHAANTLSDYVTAVAWSLQGDVLAASTSAGEVVLWHSAAQSTLLTTGSQAIDCIAFSPDGQFLATGMMGGVQIWRWQEQKLITTLGNATAWVDQLAWSPTANQLAYSLGRYVQVWDADTGEIAATLNFESSSVLGLDWRAEGQHLAIAGYQGAKIWSASDWDQEPYFFDVPSASVAITWSPDGKYLATGNMDRTIALMEWNNPYPWVMRGFPGKIRSLAWSAAKTQVGAPLLAACSVEGIVVWEKQADESLGWEGRVLEQHTAVVWAIAFHPQSFLLASAAEDGHVCLWHKARRLTQILTGAEAGFSCLAWHPTGQQLAAGGHNGELLIWSKAMRGQGFGRR